MACAKRVILLREGRAEQGHNAVALEPADGALIVMNRIDHRPQDEPEPFRGFLGIHALDAFERSFGVAKQNRDLLALAQKRLPRGQDPLTQVSWD
jgi:hypothetical protein